jgi:hypothetical protein
MGTQTDSFAVHYGHRTSCIVCGVSDCKHELARANLYHRDDAVPSEEFIRSLAFAVNVSSEKNVYQFIDQNSDCQ